MGISEKLADELGLDRTGIHDTGIYQMVYYLYSIFISLVKYIYTHIYTVNYENEFRVHCDVPIYSSVLIFPLFTERWYKVHVLRVHCT